MDRLNPGPGQEDPRRHRPGDWLPLALARAHGPHEPEYPRLQAGPAGEGRAGRDACIVGRVALPELRAWGRAEAGRWFRLRLKSAQLTLGRTSCTMAGTVGDGHRNYPLPNLFASMRQRLGIAADRFASSTGAMRGLEPARTNLRGQPCRKHNQGKGSFAKTQQLCEALPLIPSPVETSLWQRIP